MTVTIRTDIIEKYRNENNLTVTAFCKKCGISNGTYHKLMQQQTHIRLTVIVKVLNTMKIKCSDLVEIED